MTATVIDVPGTRSDTTTERLVTAASEVFAEKGYDGAGVAEIARRAGLTTGAIYSRFTGKAELLAAAVHRFHQDEFDRLFAEHAFAGRATDILHSVGAHLVTREPQPGHALLLEAFVAARRNPEVARLLREDLEERAGRMAKLVRQGQDEGSIDPDLDTASVVQFAHAVGLGFLLFEAVGRDNPDPAAWDQVIQRMVHALTVPADQLDTTTPVPDATNQESSS